MGNSQKQNKFSTHVDHTERLSRNLTLILIFITCFFHLTEIQLMLLFWAILCVTWLFGGLHMAYSQLWSAIMFCVFNIILVSLLSQMKQNESGNSVENYSGNEVNLKVDFLNQVMGCCLSVFISYFFNMSCQGWTGFSNQPWQNI